MFTVPASQIWRTLLVVFVAVICLPTTVFGQTPGETTEFTLRAGRSMRVALDHRVVVRGIGQPVTGTLVEAVYVYDRVVFPIGTRATGTIERIDAASKTRRILGMIGGDFSPHPQVTLRFDRVITPEGQTLPIVTTVRGGTLRARRHVAAGTRNTSEGDETGGSVARLREAVTTQAREALALLEDPGKMERLEEMALNQLPYHPEFLLKGTVYTVEVLQAVDVGSFVPSPSAPAGSAPAPNSILTAKLATTVDSGTTPRGTAITAVLTQPVFSLDHHVILPEGTTLTGEVTFAKPARRWRRNGKLRVLFVSVQPPAATSRPLLASLYSVEVGAAERVAVDEEGGTSITNSKTRFIPPALAVLAVRGSAHQGHELDDDDVGVPPHIVATEANPGVRALGGFFGFGVVGAIAGQFSRPVAIAVSVVGAARTIYTSVFAKGREVTFSAETPIQVRLAPGPPVTK
jgi:hypothetical protein